MTDDTQIPGFSADQTWALRQVVREAVQAANAHDERVRKLEDCVFGNGKDGLKDTMTGVKKDIGSLVWWYRLLTVGVIGSWLTLLGSSLIG